MTATKGLPCSSKELLSWRKSWSKAPNLLACAECGASAALWLGQLIIDLTHPMIGHRRGVRSADIVARNFAEMRLSEQIKNRDSD